MRKIYIILFALTSTILNAQEKFSNVQISDPKTLILNAKEGDFKKSGKLTSGEIVTTGCSGGACYFRIDYKGRNLEQIIGSDIKDLKMYEFDFGNDGDKEIIVVNDFLRTSYLFIYSYGRGLIEKLFQKEILYYKTIINKNYIEYYMPSGLDQVWNYYQGHFWAMSRIEVK